MAGHLHISWASYHQHIEQLARSVHSSGYALDHVLCLARGGLRVGDVFSRIFSVPLHILATSSYRERAGTQQGEFRIAEHITSTDGSLSGRVLLVDDLVDSGTTLLRVQAHLASSCPAVTEIRTAVLWYKACSVVRPDYYVDYLADNPWIHQPFEVYDDFRL